ncbi:acyl-CoA dehydrogenase family protein [Pseudomonas protegens]|uniref:Putative acyl-CoA dehydrogenase YngJ n=1 Tax=Pseudomonas protegens (strain DSM 19095 / LMG 27888 / CFBP 6595 / CHA0) TaxID=1124983 RepID=A0A2C9EI32_PSEPH|nr:acyl-CoA dehydrogenase family protein [Pseudomonas protegens]AGL83304.1 putative acyl-CoA dehydrogenase YngJ [Pseudomonas protegens CHA0]MBP5110633.1 acyl-CoA dehydrogenase family protein [Pseudomonas protegens]QTU25215.1 acyl-CoA dehydrogenase family protein [Pseudomonas protegens]QTU34745.1 acyl-CoA dehydrogenase family protein [Pseudomonas protegens]RLO20278.1 pimeloyl-CoA dehydrogenase large subunit [Pseudomonas protegens]
MDLSFTPQEEAFRNQVQAFLAKHLPSELSDKVANGERLSKADMEHWHSTLNTRGWLANHWPEAFGGPGWSAVEKFIFELECGLANAPRIVPFGVNMLGPVLIKYGTPQQQDYWLPRILDGRHWWCQGYSEPGAGSDLAAVKTTAVRDGDHYVVNGQKTWTTLGQHANMIFCLVRTDREAKPQEGISFLLIDMASPGVEVRPIITLEGDHEINEVFFTDVRVPVANLVGEENKGWTCAKYLLTYERTNIAGVGLSMAALQRLKRVAAQRTRNGRPLLEDPQFAARLARVEIDLENMKTTNLRVIAAVAGGGAPGAESSMLKICGTEIRQELTALLRRAMGPAARVMLDEGDTGAMDLGPAFASSAAAQYFNNRKLSIFGGSNEIQKNIISKMILGL